MKLYYVVSYPKSGATWFRTLMYSLFNGKATGSREISEFYPELPNEMDLIKKKHRKPKRHILCKKPFILFARYGFIG